MLGITRDQLVAALRALDERGFITWDPPDLTGGVELLKPGEALVIDEEHDELNIRIILFDLANFLHDILSEGLGVDPLPDWLMYLDSKVVGGLGELVDELVDGVVAFLVLLSKGCVDTSPIIEFNILLIDLFDLEETIIDIDSLATGGNDLKSG